MAIAALRYYSKRLNELDADLDPAVQPALSGVVEGPALSGVEGSEVERSPERSRRVNPEPSRKGARQVAAFATDRLVLVASPQQSADLVASRQPAIVIASSGMATGGRVLRHLAAALPNAKNTVLFAGFQADGTRGRQLVEGAKEIRMLGRAIPVAARIEHLESMSAHADAGEIMRWLSGFSRPPQTVFLVHGEPAGLQALAARITAERNWPVHIAAHRETVTLAV